MKGCCEDVSQIIMQLTIKVELKEKKEAEKEMNICIQHTPIKSAMDFLKNEVFSMKVKKSPSNHSTFCTVVCLCENS